LTSRSDKHREAGARDRDDAGSIADGQRSVAVDDDRAATEIGRDARNVAEASPVLDVADRADAAADADRDRRCFHAHAAVVTDVAADEAQNALGQGRTHRAAAAGRFIDKLVDDEIAVLADIEGAAIEKHQLCGSAALGDDAILEKDVAAWRQGPSPTSRRAPCRRCIGGAHRADDLLRSCRNCASCRQNKRSD